MARIQILSILAWLVFPYIVYWSYMAHLTPAMAWTFLAIMLLLELSSFVVNYLMVRVAAWFVGLKARIATRIFGARMAGWIIGN